MIAFNEGDRVFADDRGVVMVHVPKSVNLIVIEYAVKRIGKESICQKKEQARLL